MAGHLVTDGETWESMATDFDVPLSWLLLSNGCDPQSPAQEPEVGSEIAIPGPPPAYSVAPETGATLDLGAGGLHGLHLQLHDADGEEMTNVRYSLRFSGRTLRSTSADGWVTVKYPATTCARIELAWGDAADGGDGYLYRTEVVTDPYTREDDDYVAISDGTAGAA